MSNPLYTMTYTTLIQRLTVGLAALALTVCTAFPAYAQDAEDNIRQMLEQRDQQIKSILQGDTTFTSQQREELKTLINGVIDFRAMGQQALGPFWGDLSEAQRTEFVDVFRDIVRSQSLADLEVYNSQVTYNGIDVQGDSAFVRTTTDYQGTSAEVAYVLERQESTWLAEDIIVDDVSTAGSYARSFQTVVRKRGFDALMNSLRKKREQIAARN
jgi:phospholipid transport system substrate-binding protein